MVDLEKGTDPPHYLIGYPSLAEFIASDPDQTSAIFKRFRRLAARNLLHLQSELAELQAKQDNLDELQRHEKGTTKQYSRNWPEFCEVSLYDHKQKERKEVAEAIRVTMKEYRVALLHESQVSILQQPTTRTFEAFRYNFFYHGQGRYYPTLGAHSTTVYDDVGDLVSLHIQEEKDRLTIFVQNHLAWMFQTQKRHGSIRYTSDGRMVRFVAILSTINAAALLIGAIVSLYSVTSPKIKLGIIALFTSLFAINVGVLTNARRAELFAATAGYAAVLVVFVSGNLSAG